MGRCTATPLRRARPTASSQRTSGRRTARPRVASAWPSHPRQVSDVEPICARRSWAEPKAGAERRLMLSQRRQAGRIRLRLRIDRQEIVVTLEEGRDSLLVLGAEDRAGNIDDPPALLDETQRGFQRLVLILDALLERAGAHAPFGVGIAPPGPGPRAGRVDQHEIAARLEVGEHIGWALWGAHLDIAGA